MFKIACIRVQLTLLNCSNIYLNSSLRRSPSSNSPLPNPTPSPKKSPIDPPKPPKIIPNLLHTLSHGQKKRGQSHLDQDLDKIQEMSSPQELAQIMGKSSRKKSSNKFHELKYFVQDGENSKKLCTETCGSEKQENSQKFMQNICTMFSDESVGKVMSSVERFLNAKNQKNTTSKKQKNYQLFLRAVHKLILKQTKNIQGSKQMIILLSKCNLESLPQYLSSKNEQWLKYFNKQHKKIQFTLTSNFNNNPQKKKPASLEIKPNEQKSFSLNESNLIKYISSNYGTIETYEWQSYEQFIQKKEHEVTFELPQNYQEDTPQKHIKMQKLQITSSEHLQSQSNKKKKKSIVQRILDKGKLQRNLALNKSTIVLKFKTHSDKVRFLSNEIRLYGLCVNKFKNIRFEQAQSKNVVALSNIPWQCETDEILKLINNSLAPINLKLSCSPGIITSGYIFLQLNNFSESLRSKRFLNNLPFQDKILKAQLCYGSSYKFKGEYRYCFEADHYEELLKKIANVRADYRNNFLI